MPDIPTAPAPGARNFKTHCIHGHPLDDAYLTTHYWAGKKLMRICRPCQLARIDTPYIRPMKTWMRRRGDRATITTGKYAG